MVDWFSLGCLMYTMLTGKVAIKIPRVVKLMKEFYENIKIPTNLTEDSQSLLKGLLKFNPNERLGHGKEGVNQIKEHPFFKDIDWEMLWEKKVNPPMKPSVKSINDLRYFDKCFIDEKIDIKDDNKTASDKTRGSNISQFTYIGGSMLVEMSNNITRENSDADRFISKTEGDV